MAIHGSFRDDMFHLGPHVLVLYYCASPAAIFETLPARLVLAKHYLGPILTVGTGVSNWFTVDLFLFIIHLRGP